MKVTGSHDLYQQFKSLKYSIQKDLCNVYWEHINSLISVDTANSNCFKQSKRFWSCIKSLKKSSTGINVEAVLMAIQLTICSDTFQTKEAYME